MDDQTTKIIAQALANLTTVAARNTVGAISDKIKAAKAKQDQTETINELENIINNLIEDKNELERVARTLENELASQQISDDDINFIVETIIPMVEQFTKDDKKQQAYIDAVKSLLSKETLKVVQLIGFNYREAIGVPLTRLCASAIQNLEITKDKQSLERINAEYQSNLVKISQDKDAYDRFARLIGRTELISTDENKKESA